MTVGARVGGERSAAGAGAAGLGRPREVERRAGGRRASASGALGGVVPSGRGAPSALGSASGSKASPLRRGLAAGEAPSGAAAAAGRPPAAVRRRGAGAGAAPPSRNSTSCWKRFSCSSSRRCWFSNSSMRPLACRNSFSSRSMRTIERAGVAGSTGVAAGNDGGRRAACAVCGGASRWNGLRSKARAPSRRRTPRQTKAAPARRRRESGVKTSNPYRRRDRRSPGRRAGFR